MDRLVEILNPKAGDDVSIENMSVVLSFGIFAVLPWPPFLFVALNVGINGIH